MNKRFVRQSLEEYALRHMLPRPDLWPAIRRQVQPAAAAPRRFPINNLGRVVLPTVILLGVVALALAFGPLLKVPTTFPVMGTGNDPGPARPPTRLPMPITEQGIYLARIDGGVKTLLVGPPLSVLERPAWAPNGTELAVSAQHEAGYSNYEILVMRVDGSNQTLLTHNFAFNREPAWSPDGHRIAFTSGPPKNSEIYVVDTDGSNSTRLTNNDAMDIEATWSPDGKRIAFTSNRDGRYQIYLMNADGSGQQRLTSNTANDLYPAWAPDGTQIAFDSDRDGNQEIYVMRTDGTDQTRLTTDPNPDLAPAWSPDGLWISFTSRRDGDAEIYRMKADGSAQMNLTHSPDIDEAWAAWSPDGQQLAFFAAPYALATPPAVAAESPTPDTSTKK